MPAICKAQTTKQAKASFKARGRPSLSDAEQRQLVRAIELEERAERSKEAEKRRAEAVRKRSEQGKRDKAEREKSQLLSQRRCDKFGFKASQFHLGAFFGKPMAEATSGKVQYTAQDDVYEDDGLDDEELLEALETANSNKSQPQPKQVPESDSMLMPPPPRPQPAILKRSNTEPTPIIDQDLSNFWDDLESSTQVARELNSNSPNEQQTPEPKAGSFSSEDFDLTAEDLDELDPPRLAGRTTEANAQSAKTSHNLPMKAAKKAMPPPSLPAKRVQNKMRTQNAIRGPFLPASSLYCSPELGFTLTQLENFVEDDLQLTQAVPG
ncbi:hypothetical protein M409DRAFT_53294 [Zasmidium cellare ATCC 36951]|uniref:Uncharacterized protein n=1 Tax=Zasmidium cellare ATCC 36951 TaxID=1080233 RepID=A0A6A6CN24_ZASCE|nr:uncharacterized protein M409DRAFT_53294 [Zasmidium cellare ATCC 36951]KAF2168657.1 hypothetical protein M409DRAFT_53294 [Zasmidium cellare ATCC 36951]